MMFAPLLLSMALQPPLSFAASTEVVRVDVLVTRGGRPVSGLRLEDFQILEASVPQKIEFVRTDRDTPIDMLLLFDGSASVHGNLQRMLLDAAAAAMKGLRSTDRVALVPFSHEIRSLVGFTSRFDDVTSALKSAEPRGSTSLGDALVAASLAFEPNEARRLIFLFTDGSDTSSFLAGYQVLEALARADALVYTFTLNQGSGSRPGALLRPATEITGGRVVNEKDPGKLAAAFGAAIAEVRARYLLSYIPSGAITPGWRPIEVKVKGGAQVRARRGYVR